MERKNYLVPTLIFLLLILSGAVVYLLLGNNKNSNNNNNNETIKWEVKTDRYYNGTTTYTNDGYTDEKKAQILFRPNGTFVQISTLFGRIGYEGTYSINGNSLTLKATEKYGSDTCYYNVNETFTYAIKDDGQLNGAVSFEDGKTNLNMQEIKQSDSSLITSHLNSKFVQCDSNGNPIENE